MSACLGVGVGVGVLRVISFTHTRIHIHTHTHTHVCVCNLCPLTSMHETHQYKKEHQVKLWTKMA